MTTFIPFSTENKQPLVGQNMTIDGNQQPALQEMVKVETPPETATSESEAVSIALPTQFVFYGFKSLYVKPFKGVHLRKLVMAKETGSTRFTVEAVSSVLSTPTGETNLGFKLTIPDFYYVLYWLRKNSFLKNALRHTSLCRNPDHAAKVVEKLAADEATRQNIPLDKVKRIPLDQVHEDTWKISELVTSTFLKEVILQEVPNFQLEYPGVKLHQCTMEDALLISEHPKITEPDTEAQLGLAAYIQGIDIQLTLDQRLAVVDDMSLDDLELIREYERLTKCGIDDTVRVRCAHCGYSQIDPVFMDAHAFFPSAA